MDCIQNLFWKLVVGGGDHLHNIKQLDNNVTYP